MYAIQSLARNSSKVLNVTVQQCRNYDSMVTKPRHRVPLAEKVILGTLMLTVPLIYPFYISTKFSEWTASNKDN